MPITCAPTIPRADNPLELAPVIAAAISARNQISVFVLNVVFFLEPLPHEVYLHVHAVNATDDLPRGDADGAYR